VIATNDAMIALLRRLGFALRRHPGDARLMQVTLALRPAAATRPARPGAATAAVPSGAPATA
jgi:hypothetical protein